jgi:hypothetical protein
MLVVYVQKQESKSYDHFPIPGHQQPHPRKGPGCHVSDVKLKRFEIFPNDVPAHALAFAPAVAADGCYYVVDSWLDVGFVVYSLDAPSACHPISLPDSISTAA